MRELKFRQWSNSQNKYVDATFICVSTDGWLFSLDEAYAIEQYTGLKDKNGKDIYEGDIVEEKINTGDYGVDGTYRYKVVWDDDMLCWSLNPNSTSIHKDLWECNHSLKVIGNVHENPELKGGEE